MTFRYDPSDPAIIEDPYPAYETLRNDYPLYYLERYGIWAVSRFEDVLAISRDRRRFSTRGGVDLDLFGYELIGDGNFLEMDPPRHDSLRNVVRSRFSPRHVKLLEGVIRQDCDSLLNPISERGSADLAEDFAWILPMRTLCRMLGLPPEDHDMLGGLFRTMTTRVPGEPEVPPVAREAAAEMRQYLAEIAGQRQRCRRDDLISDIGVAEVDGKRLSQSEIVGVCLLLFMAGVGTAGAFVSNFLLALGDHPEQRAVVQQAAARSNTEALRVATEELLRFESPIQNLLRTSGEDVALHGATVPSGARIALLYGAANRDPRQFDRPDVFDVQREPKRHLAFGEGLHFCLGNVLARLEGRIAVEAVLAVLPSYEVSGSVVRSALVGERGVLSLPVTW